MQGLGKKLRQGRPVLNVVDNSVDIVSASSEVLYKIPAREFKDQDWGYVYERYVGLLFEELGYEVMYHGLESGFADGGIDLIAKKQDELPVYIQCKLKRGSSIGKQACERLLYKADLFLRKIIPKSCSSPVGRFVLVIPSLCESFVSITRKNGKVFYPVADYFLSKNNFQKYIRLEIMEIKFPFN